MKARRAVRDAGGDAGAEADARKRASAAKIALKRPGLVGRRLPGLQQKTHLALSPVVRSSGPAHLDGIG